MKLSRVNARLLILQLSVMLNAGISLDRTLGSLADSDSGELREVGSRIHRFITHGYALSAAIRQSCTRFAPVHIALIRAGEQTGGLGTVLQTLSERLESEKRAREQLVSSLAYPLGILVVGGFMLFFMTSFMLPQFLEAAGPALSDPPWPTKVLMWISDSQSFLFLLLLLALLSIPWLMSDVPAAVNVRNWFLYRSPLLGKINRLNEQARVSHEFGLLLNAGLTVHSALGHLVVGDPRLQKALERSRMELMAGHSLSEAFDFTGEFSKDFVAILSVGEETGKLGSALGHQAAYLEENCSRLVADALKLLEPFAMLVLGFFVGFVVLGCFLPIYQMVAENL